MRSRMKQMEDRLETMERMLQAIHQRLSLPLPNEIAERQLEPFRLHIPQELLARFDTEDDQ